MVHNIIVKWNEKVEDKEEMLEKVSGLFSEVVFMDFVESCDVIPNCVDRPNRCDVMISVRMKKEDLPLWDESELHHKWKDTYGGYIASKAIFDCE